MPNKNKHAARLGKLGGKSKSNAKRDAARINGAKGGRPRKAKVSDESDSGSTPTPEPRLYGG
jgi:hypothetical protein